MIFDTFCLFNELDLLEIRLHELWGVVNRFVIVESTKTHRGLHKPLFFEENKARFERYLSKITHLVSADPFGDVNPWVRENYQRDQVMKGLLECHDTDAIIIADADEICRSEAVLLASQKQGIVRLELDLFYCNLNSKSSESWNPVRILPYGLLKSLSPTSVRLTKPHCPEVAPQYTLPRAGWHFSYCGDAAQIATKIKAFAHQEFNTPDFTDETLIQKHMAEGTDLFNRKEKDLCITVPVDETFPKYVQEHQDELLKKGLLKPWKTEVLPEVRGDKKCNCYDCRMKNSPAKKLLAEHKTIEITTTISTKNRYETTLPLALNSVAQQTLLPKNLWIYDDNTNPVDLRNHPVISHLLGILHEKGVATMVYYGQKRGQVANHQTALDACKTEYLFRMDDDNVLEPNVLATLAGTMEIHPKAAAVGGLVWHSGRFIPECPKFVDNSLPSIGLNLNAQWFKHADKTVTHCDHLYSTFLLKTALAQKIGYEKNLSVVGSREETILTHSLKRAGHDVLFTPQCVTWHLHAAGGIRSAAQEQFWHRDEEKFHGYLRQWGVTLKDYFWVVLDCGLGDHLAFRQILPELRQKHPGKTFLMAVCYPEVFPEEDSCSISDAQVALGNLEKFNVYRWCAERNWKGHLKDAFLGLYGN